MPHLTPRERQLLALLLQDKCNKEIARELGIKECTVKEFCSNIFRKLGVRSRTGAVALALQESYHLSFGIGSEYPTKVG